MLQVNDTVLYGTEGLCTIDEIGDATFGGTTREYYTLHPLGSGRSVIYVPTDCEKLCSRMRPVLTKGEIRSMLTDLKKDGPLWIENEDERKKAYDDALQEGNRRALLRMLCALYRRRPKIKKAGRRLHICDERFMKEAQRILEVEFSFVSGRDPEELEPLLTAGTAAAN